MTKADLNLALIQNFILHITHSSPPNDRVNGEDEYAAVPMTFTPDELYQMAEDYIDEDHCDGRENPENNIEIQKPKCSNCDGMILELDEQCPECGREA